MADVVKQQVAAHWDRRAPHFAGRRGFEIAEIRFLARAEPRLRNMQAEGRYLGQRASVAGAARDRRPYSSPFIPGASES